MTEIEAPISKVTSEKIILDLGDRKGIISKNDVALDARDKTTARFKVGEMVRAVVISEKHGVVKLSIRELYKQQRDLERKENERTEAVRLAMATATNDGQARRRRVSEERENFASNVAAWLQREKQRKWAARKAYLRRCCVVAALGIVAVFTFMSKPPQTQEPPQEAKENSPNAPVLLNASVQFADFLNTQAGVDFLKAQGVDVVFARKADVKTMKYIPNKTIVVFKD